MKPINDGSPVVTHTEATSIDPMALSSLEAVNEEYCRLPSDLAYWAGVYAQSLGEYLEAKAKSKQLEGVLYLRYRATQTPDGKTPTEKYVEACINTDAAYIAQVALRDSAEVQKVWSGGIVDAIDAKRDALITMGANTRREMESVNLNLNTESRTTRLEKKLRGE